MSSNEKIGRIIDIGLAPERKGPNVGAYWNPKKNRFIKTVYARFLNEEAVKLANKHFRMYEY